MVATNAVATLTAPSAVATKFAATHATAAAAPSRTHGLADAFAALLAAAADSAIASSDTAPGTEDAYGGDALPHHPSTSWRATPSLPAVLLDLSVPRHATSALSAASVFPPSPPQHRIAVLYVPGGTTIAGLGSSGGGSGSSQCFQGPTSLANAPPAGVPFLLLVRVDSITAITPSLDDGTQAGAAGEVFFVPACRHEILRVGPGRAPPSLHLGLPSGGSTKTFGGSSEGGLVVDMSHVGLGPVSVRDARRILAAYTAILPYLPARLALLAQCYPPGPDARGSSGAPHLLGFDPDGAPYPRVYHAPLSQSVADLIGRPLDGLDLTVCATYDLVADDDLSIDEDDDRRTGQPRCRVSLRTQSGAAERLLLPPLFPSHAAVDVTFVDSATDPDSHAATRGLRVQLRRLLAWSRVDGDIEASDDGDGLQATTLPPHPRPDVLSALLDATGPAAPIPASAASVVSPSALADSRELDFVERLWRVAA
ncbi:hypothetical protein HK405_010421, partial [Cladochytrium tenue]